MKKLLFILLVVVLTACSARGDSDLSRNRQKWQDANISHYRFNVFVSCFCAFNEDMPLVIEVQNGEVISMEYKSGKPIEDMNREFFGKFATVDRLFSELEVDLGGEADHVTVTYDATYGFPVEVGIDYIENAADDELYLTVSGFEALP